MYMKGDLDLHVRRVLPILLNKSMNISDPLARSDRMNIVGLNQTTVLNIKVHICLPGCLKQKF